MWSKEREGGEDRIGKEGEGRSEEMIGLERRGKEEEVKEG